MKSVHLPGCILYYTHFIPHLIWQCGVNFSISVKLHVPACKNDHYFLKPNIHVETIMLTVGSVRVTRRNSWLVLGPLNSLWTSKEAEVILAFLRQKDLKGQSSNVCPSQTESGKELFIQSNHLQKVILLVQFFVYIARLCIHIIFMFSTMFKHSPIWGFGLLVAAVSRHHPFNWF